MAAVCHLGILKLKFLTALHFRNTFCIILPNFVDIGYTVAEILQPFVFFPVKCKKMQMIVFNMT